MCRKAEPTGDGRLEKDNSHNSLLRTKLHRPPVKRFWAVTAYDPLSRALLDSGGNITVSSTRGVDANPDGSVDVYFGPKAPKGKEKNFIKTDPDKGFFVVFRFYGPLEGYIEKTWVMNDFEEVK